MALRLRNMEYRRLIAAGLVLLVGITCTYAHVADPGSKYRDFSLSLDFFVEAVGFLGLIFLVFLSAPLFLVYRVLTAPLNSGVFLIVYLTCAASGFMLYEVSSDCRGADVCGIFRMLALVTIWFGAFCAIFPKWKGES